MSLYNLTFDILRAANVRRLPQFKNARGEPAHSKPDGSDWPLDAWSNAALGELLGDAVATKFNEISERVGADVRIPLS